MALLDKDILITPNTGQTADPKIEFKGADSTTGAQIITLNVYPTNGGTVSFEGSAGQLFSIANTMTGTIYSVNDVSGIPSIEVVDTGLVKLAQYNGNVLVGTGTDNGTDKLQVNGAIGQTYSNLNSATYTTASTSQVSVDAWSSTTFRSAKYFVQITSGSNYHVTELNVVHNGTTAYVVEYGENKTGTNLGSFDASVSGGNVTLLFTATNAVTTIKLFRTAVNI